MKSKNSVKSFGLLFFIVFLLIGLWPLMYNGDLRIWSLIFSVVFLILAFAGFEKRLKEGNNKIVGNVAKILVNAFLLFIFFNLNLSH